MASVWPPDVGLKLIYPWYQSTRVVLDCKDNLQAGLIFATKFNFRDREHCSLSTDTVELASERGSR